MTLLRLSDLDELWEGEMRGLRVAGKRVLLARIDGELCAYADRCAHLGLPLSEGTLEGHVLHCRAHGWTYDLKTGCGIAPRTARLQRLALEVRGGEVWIDPEQASEDHVAK